jgi:hypothetical protein
MPHDPPAKRESEIRAMLVQSRREIDAGLTIPLDVVAYRMRAIAEAIRRERATGLGTEQIQA